MKPYLLFAGEDYYPSGGMEDFRGTFNTIAEAVEWGQQYGWWQVVIHESMTTIVKGRK